MAGVTVPSVLMVFALASFCVVRFGFNFPLPIERAVVFPIALGVRDLKVVKWLVSFFVANIRAYVVR
jgi:hypothetical protein